MEDDNLNEKLIDEWMDDIGNSLDTELPVFDEIAELFKKHNLSFAEGVSALCFFIAGQAHGGVLPEEHREFVIAVGKMIHGFYHAILGDSDDNTQH